MGADAPGILSMKRPLLLHPFLFALFPVVFVYSQNIEFMGLQEAWPVAPLLLGGALVLLLLLSLILRDAFRAGGILALFLFLFFSFGPVRDALLGHHLLDMTANQLLPIGWALVFAAGTALILRTRSGWDNITKTLNVVAAVLILPSLVGIGISQAGSGPSGGEQASADAAS